MSHLYADENFDAAVVDGLRGLGHDVLTADEAGKAGQKIPDDQVLAHAVSLGRAVLTFNRWDFVSLHKKSSKHCGIVVCTPDDDADALTRRIDQKIVSLPSLDTLLIRVNKS